MFYIKSAENVSESSIHDAFATGSVISSTGWFGHGVHESLKDPQEHGRWFEAAAKSCRAGRAALMEGPTVAIQSEAWIVDYIQPLVVIDGALLSAELDDRDELQLEEIKFASVLFEEHEQQSARTYIVDLVRLDVLPEYIAGLNRGFDNVFQLLGEYRGIPAMHASRPKT